VESSRYHERPDYRVDILPRRNRVQVFVGDEQLADTTRSLLVDEQDHGLVFYLPRDDVRMDLLAATTHTSRCPFKGSASYWRLASGEGPEKLAWSYEAPYPEVARIAGYLAFYQDQVRLQVGTAPYNGPRR
jgi:uncharacterized protein (DUF427 family)